MKPKVIPIAVLVVACGGEGFSTSAARVDGGPRGSGGGVVGTGVTHSDGGVSSGGAASGGATPVLGGTASASGGISGSSGREAGAGGSSGSTGGILGSSGGSSGGSGSGDACSLVTHSNGAGQTWQDCVPLGTHDESQAMKACEAWCAANGGCTCDTGTSAPCNDSLKRVHALSGGFFMGWPWQGPNAGDVTKSSTGGTCTVVGTWD